MRTTETPPPLPVASATRRPRRCHDRERDDLNQTTPPGGRRLSAEGAESQALQPVRLRLSPPSFDVVAVRAPRGPLWSSCVSNVSVIILVQFEPTKLQKTVSSPPVRRRCSGAYLCWKLADAGGVGGGCQRSVCASLRAPADINGGEGRRVAHARTCTQRPADDPFASGKLSHTDRCASSM